MKPFFSNEVHQVFAFEDLGELHQAAAKTIVQGAKRAIAERGRFLCALSGGGTPAGAYTLLANSPYRERISWARTHWFWGDERLVPPEHPESNYGQAYQRFLGRVPVPGEQIHRVRGELSAEQASLAYAQELRGAATDGLDWPRFDISLLGLGSDGHTASLFPGKTLPSDQPVIPVQATYQDRPAVRISLTPLVFNTSRQIVFLVAGPDKAAALAAVILAKQDLERWPAQRIRSADSKIIWLIDRDAAAGLP